MFLKVQFYYVRTRFISDISLHINIPWGLAQFCFVFGDFRPSANNTEHTISKHPTPRMKTAKVFGYSMILKPANKNIRYAIPPEDSSSDCIRFSVLHIRYGYFCLAKKCPTSDAGMYRTTNWNPIYSAFPLLGPKLAFKISHQTPSSPRRRRSTTAQYRRSRGFPTKRRQKLGSSPRFASPRIHFNAPTRTTSHSAPLASLTT
jgi:hypothetical protein